jgi:dephospho-CoA kinase
VHSDGTLDRAALADQAFTNKRLDELNAIVHPAVIAAQEKGLRQLAAAGHLLAVVESALIFEVSGEVSREVSRNAPDDAPSGAPDNAPGDLPAGGSVPGWRNRFDRIVLVAAPEAVRVERYVARVLAHGGPAQGTDELRADTLREDARRRMAAQLPDGWKRRHSDYVIENDRTLVLLRREALRVLKALRGEANARSLPATTF